MRIRVPTRPSKAVPGRGVTVTSEPGDTVHALELRTVFCESLFRFMDLAHGFTADNLRLEELVLHCRTDGQEAPAPTFNTPESTLGHDESRRVKFLLLDIVYGEPTSAVIRIPADLTGDRGRLRAAWELALGIRDGAPTPAGATDLAQRAVAEYAVEVFRPNLARCRALWNGLPAPERALLSSDVTDVMAEVTARLNALESAFSAVDHGCWALQTADHRARA
ncbi:hypothetical protein [Streptomyces sp. NPDC089919]|uniref:hypothetical protein n=1 Tax=Streptomyces sp. NPDC089919 TaxID=3155188 RepID=UPI00343090B9